MQQLSSNLTLGLRLFIPTVWLVFFGSFTVAAWLTQEDMMGPFQTYYFKLGATLFVLSGIIFFYFTVWRLYRVDGNGEALIVSNYLKTIRYEFPRVERIEMHDYGLFTLGEIKLVQAGSFGKRIWFLSSAKRASAFMQSYPLWILNKGA